MLQKIRQNTPICALLGTGVKSTRLVRSRLETVCPMGSGARGVLVLHSDISDFFLVVCAMFSPIFLNWDMSSIGLS